MCEREKKQVQWVFDKTTLGGRHQRGKINYPLEVHIDAETNLLCIDAHSDLCGLVTKESTNVIITLSGRTSKVLAVIIKLTNGCKQSTTYKAIKETLGENPRYCRGIGRSCRAIYDRGWTDIHGLVVK